MTCNDKKTFSHVAVGERFWYHGWEDGRKDSSRGWYTRITKKGALGAYDGPEGFGMYSDPVNGRRDDGAMVWFDDGDMVYVREKI